MDHEFELLLYFDERQILLNMKCACDEFLKELNEKTVFKFPPLRFLLELDVMDLLNLYPDVGEFLIQEPLKWQRCCNDILYACMKSFDNDMNQHIKSTQVAVIIRLKSFPRLFANTKQRTYNNIVSLCGLLIDFTKPTSYVYHTVWSCPEECEGNETVMHYIPKVTPKCYLCRSTLFENSGLRRCGEQVQATFKFKNDLLPKKFIITEDLIKKLKLGSSFIINVVVLKKMTSVWSIEEFVTLPAPITSCVPTDVKELFQACNGIPWKFIYCLASSIGVGICPLNCFMNIKISLLLSLVSVKANVANGSVLHFLAGGYDTGYVGKLMQSAASLADTYTLFGPSNSSVATTLIGASGGACVMPLPLQTYSQQQIHTLLSIIESGEITQGVNKTKLRCAVWAQGMDFKKILLHNIGSVFGSICHGDHGEYADELVDFALNQAIESDQRTKEEVQALHNVSKYIDLVAGINVTLDEETERLLRCYFLTARKERPKAVSASSFGALITICGTSARLCRRKVTNNNDAVFAIWLHVCGMPEPRFAPEEYLQTPADIKKLKKVMDNFIGWLEQFTGYSIHDRIEDN